MIGKPRPKVLFIGTGAIGFPMIQHIHSAGFPVLAVEPAAEQRTKLMAASIPSLSGIASTPDVDVVIVMVATPEQLDDVVSAAVSVQVAGQVWIIMSTVGPVSLRAAQTRLEQAGARVMDAPVTGGVAGARAASLRIFAAGSANDLELATPILRCCGHVEVVGSEPGQGQAIKTINQHLCTVHLVAAAEALALARSMGLDPADVLRLVGQGAAGSWMLRDRGPRMLSDQPEVTSTVGIFLKDSFLVEQAAVDAGNKVPVLAAARQQLLAAEGLELWAADDSQVIRTY
jgi:3-hydroxyisobutyrate dehydrogenase